MAAGYPHWEHSDFWMWYDERPQRRHRVCVLLRRFPKLDVPFVCWQENKNKHPQLDNLIPVRKLSLTRSAHRIPIQIAHHPLDHHLPTSTEPPFEHLAPFIRPGHCATISRLRSRTDKHIPQSHSRAGVSREISTHPDAGGLRTGGERGLTWKYPGMMANNPNSVRRRKISTTYHLYAIGKERERVTVGGAMTSRVCLGWCRWRSREGASFG